MTSRGVKRRRIPRCITNDKHKLTPGFASRYNLRWLVYYETTTDEWSLDLR